MPKLRPYKYGDEARIARARQYLAAARLLLIAAGAKRTAARVARALKSAEGAARHVERIAARFPAHAHNNEPRYCCDNCERQWYANELNEPADLDERLDYPPGDPRCVLPAGECPECGALAYEIKEQNAA